ncbi:hypothetical protein F8388_008817 [Cannabis sativa]|uniref:Ribosomal RNA methyltransferase FtsJ domain-containing protein n=1 Tax=Cannabis sativa TaxID=3483 RepID=A0A7J6EN86_CANSA|nr:hypothetical protein F8388_008817 [Cannabis sativa]
MGIESQRQGVLDLCASPSGWTQIATRRVPRGSLVVKTSLNPNASRRSKRVMRKYECSAFDLVLHYGAPNMGGAWAMEATVQNALVIDVVKLSTHLLAPKGIFVTKIFRSQDYNSIKYCLLKLFERVVVHKPNSSRSVSAEIFVLAFNYKAPTKIDPRILDVRHLFQGGIEPQKKKKFTLVEWRIHIRKALIGSEKTEVANVKNEEKEGEDDRVVREMEELTHVLECKKKRVKKLHAKRQAKEKLRKEMAMQMDGVDDSYVDRELFSLSTTKIEMPKLTNLSILPSFKIVKSRIVAAAVSRVWRKTILSLGLEDGMRLMRDEYLRCKAIWNDSLRERFTINFDLSEL